MTIWMGLENNRLSEISQTEKVKNHMISFICGIENHSNTKPRKTKTPRHKKTAQWLPEGKELRGVSVKGEEGQIYDVRRFDFGW